jgi:hypothetical protein
MPGLENQYVPRIVLGHTTTTPRQPFTLSGWPLKQHKLITGITGQGKSRLIASMCVQLKNEGIPFALVDPHGDLCEDIIKTLIATGYYTDPRAYEKLLYVDMSRSDAFVPFNVLKQPYPPHQVASLILEAWLRAWEGLTEAANLQNILLACVYVLVVTQQPLTKLAQLVSDPVYRADLLSQVSDQQVVSFFHERFDTWSKAKANALTESTLRRAFLLTFEPALRFTLGQHDNTLDFRHLMDTRISVLFNISGLSPQVQRFLGNLITIGFEQAALSRADIPENKRTAYQLFIDEFSQFSAQSGEALERMLTLVRKYGLTVNMAAQTLSQTKEIKDALQNTLHISFKMGVEDAASIAPHFTDFTKEQPGLFGQFFGHEEALVDDGQKKQEWVQLIKNLKQQEALIHVSGKTFKFRTLTVPEPHLSPGAYTQVTETYAKRILTPLHKIEQETAQSPAPSSGASTNVISLAEHAKQQTQSPSPGRRQRWGIVPDEY